jgi:hypothetical protein
MPDITTDDSGKLVTLQWPKCLQANRLTSFGLPKPLVYIGETSVGVESRQLISRVPRGAYLELEFKWISENDDHIEEFYDFWFEKAVGPWNVFLIDKSNIPCLVPGWEHYRARLPSQFWRIEVPDKLEGFAITPSNCCSIDFNLRLHNILIPPSGNGQTGVDKAALTAAVMDPTATTPNPNAR